MRKGSLSIVASCNLSYGFQLALAGVKGSVAHVNISLGDTGSYNCVYGTTAGDGWPESVEHVAQMEQSGYLHLLPELRTAHQVPLFAQGPIWFVQCFPPR